MGWKKLTRWDHLRLYTFLEPFTPGFKRPILRYIKNYDVNERPLMLWGNGLFPKEHYNNSLLNPRVYVYVNTVYIYIYKTIYAIPLLSQSSILRYLVSPQEILGTGQTCRIPAHFLWPDVQPSNKQLKAFPKDKELFIIYRSFVPRLLRRWQFFGSFIEKRLSARIKG